MTCHRVLYLGLAAVGLLGACNRAHLYKNAGMATRRALTDQAQQHGAPKPRGLDGDEAASIVAAQKRDAAPAEASAPAGGAAKPAALLLQSK